MALRAGYYGVKRFLRNKLEMIAGTYDETMKSLFPRSEQAFLGAKNLLTWWKRYKTGNNIVFTVNSDDTITVVVDTAGASSTVELLADEGMTQDYMFLAEDLRKNSCIISNTGFHDSNIFVEVVYRTSGNAFISDERLTDVVEKRLNIPESAYYVRFAIYVKNGTPAGTYNLKPMLRLATDPDDTFVSHAMTNKQLTDSATDQKTAINAIITAATGAADFAAFKTAMGAITPVTRSLSLTKEDITEEVKEDVEPEKTVTKKRTTKKTEEV